MKKNIVQDVIPPKKSIRNIELSPKTGNLTVAVKKEVPPEIKKEKVVKAETSPPPPKIPPYTYEYEETKKPSRKILYTVIGIFALALAFGISALFKSAVIRVTPEEELKTLDGNFTAKKDSVKNELGFQLVTVNGSLEKTVEAGGEQKVEKKAEGKVVLYNNYSATSQKLVATTRLQTEEGLIFRIQNNVTIPGRQTIAGKIVAGSIEVHVVADLPGENYNIGLKDFTVVGFKNDPKKYAGIYGRSKTTMTGGFSGMQKIVSEEILNNAENELEESLRDSLSRDITSQIPANFVLYANSLSYKFEPAIQAGNGEDSVVLSKKGEANGIIFDKATLTRFILTKIAPDLVETPIKINNLETLDFSYPAGSIFNPSVDNTVTFNLKGDAHLIWISDENKLKSDLLGLSKKNAMAILSTYTTIKEAWIETRPFWNQTIPEDPEKVTVINTLAR